MCRAVCVVVLSLCCVVPASALAWMPKLLVKRCHATSRSWKRHTNREYNKSANSITETKRNTHKKHQRNSAKRHTRDSTQQAQRKHTCDVQASTGTDKLESALDSRSMFVCCCPVPCSVQCVRCCPCRVFCHCHSCYSRRQHGSVSRSDRDRHTHRQSNRHRHRHMYRQSHRQAATTADGSTLVHVTSVMTVASVGAPVSLSPRAQQLQPLPLPAFLPPATLVWAFGKVTQSACTLHVYGLRWPWRITCTRAANSNALIIISIYSAHGDMAQMRAYVRGMCGCACSCIPC